MRPSLVAVIAISSLATKGNNVCCLGNTVLSTNHNALTQSLLSYYLYSLRATNYSSCNNYWSNLGSAGRQILLILSSALADARKSFFPLSFQVDNHTTVVFTKAEEFPNIYIISSNPMHYIMLLLSGPDRSIDNDIDNWLTLDWCLIFMTNRATNKQ